MLRPDGADRGLDPASMKTFATKDGSDWVLNGEKRWIGLATIADVAVVWARTDEEKNPVRGFLVPTTPPASRRRTLPRSSRCGPRSNATFDSKTCASRRARCSRGQGARRAFRLPERGRYGIIWGAMGAARDCYESALAYAKEREQFGRPIASFQLVQEKLANMLIEVGKGTLLALHIGRMKDAGH